MKKEEIDILKINTKKITKWEKLPLIYKIILIILVITLIFVPILVAPQL